MAKAFRCNTYKKRGVGASLLIQPGQERLRLSRARNTDHVDHCPMGRCWEGNACHKCPKTPTAGICTIYRKQGTRCFDVKLKAGTGPTSHLIPFTLRVPLWRCEVFNSEIHRNLRLALAAAAVLTVAGCSNQATNEATAAAKRPAAPKPAAVAKAAEPAPATMITLPKGTAISAAARQTLATDKNKVGDTFAASLTAPIQVDGKTVIPKGAQVTCRIVKVKKNEIKVTLASVVIHGKSYPLDSNSIVPKSQPKTGAKSADKAKTNKDATLLAAKSKLMFKLAKPATIPVKG
jgi:hypothetical protein